MFEDSKGVIRIHQSIKDRQYNDKKRQKEKQRSTKHTHKIKKIIFGTGLNNYKCRRMNTHVFHVVESLAFGYMAGI